MTKEDFMGQMLISSRSTSEERNVFRLVMLKAALRAECAGLHASLGPSAYSQVKQILGVKGNKFNVLRALEDHICKL